MKFPPKILCVYGIAVVGFLLDQLTKSMARLHLMSQSVDFGWFRFDLVYNTGAAYGLFSNFTSVLLWVGIVAIVYIMVSLKSLVSHWMEVVAYGVILAGAFGNTADRLMAGRVTDFINIHIIPVFNLADVFLNIGIGCIVLHYVLYARKTDA